MRRQATGLPAFNTDSGSAGRDTRGLTLLGATIALALAFAALFLLAPGAQARDSFALQGNYDFGGAFGANGPGMMATHGETLYVVDVPNSRILKFDISDPDAPQPENFSGLGSNEITEADGAPLVLAQKSNLAVDNSGGSQDGMIYLATNTAVGSVAHAFLPSGEWAYQFRRDAEGKFSPTGTPQPALAIAVSNAGASAGQIAVIGPGFNGIDSAIYGPAPTLGDPPTVIKIGMTVSGFASTSGASAAAYSSDGSTLRFLTAGFSVAGQVLTSGFQYEGKIGGFSGSPFDVGFSHDGDAMITRGTGSGGAFYRYRQDGYEDFFQGKTGTELIDSFGFGEQGTGSGMAESAAGYIYVTDAANKRINIFASATAPDAEMLDPGSVDLGTAKLRANVNPLGLTVTACNFETGPTTSYGTVVPCDVIPSGTDDVEVTADAPVTARTKYNTRVVVTAENNTRTESVNLAWQAPALPEAETLPPGPQQSTSAMLGGTVDANQTPTRFWIEYSTEPDLAGSTSAPSGEDADAGSGDAPARVFQLVDGLEPDTAYYFRLVAATKAGRDEGGILGFHTPAAPAPEPATCSNAAFRTGPSAELRECRAWERISPADKAGGSIAQGMTTPTPDGSRVLFQAQSAFAGQEDAGFGTSAAYLAERKDGEWMSRGISPGMSTPFYTPANGYVYKWLTPDLTRLLGVGRNVDLPDLPSVNSAAYLWDNDAGEIRTLAVSGPPESSATVELIGGIGGRRISDSGDSGMLVGRGLTVSSGPASPLNAVPYWWTIDGALRVAAVLPSGEVAETPTLNGVTTEAMSSDGETLLWTARQPQVRPTSEREVYVSRRAGDTLWASEAQGVEQPASTVATVLAYADDLDRVLFSSPQRLTENATAASAANDLYMYDVGLESLTDLTVADPGGGKALGVLNVSADGSTVYFVAEGDLDPAEPGSALPGKKLFSWSDSEGAGDVDFITAYPAFDSNGYGFLGVQRPYDRPTRVSSDGRYLLFPSSGSTAGTAMESVYETNGHEMLYRYDRLRDRVECVSCDPRGRGATADAYLAMPTGYRKFPGGAGAGVTAGGPERYFMSEDGRVMFNTEQSLLPADVNGDAPDGYLWDGGLKLATSGKSERGEWAEAATTDFEDVYVLSGRQLVPADEDHDVDLYVTKIGGGLASQQTRAVPPAPSCQGAACQGADNALPPTTPRLDSSRLRPVPRVEQPSGNRCQAKRKALKKAQRRVGAKRRQVKKVQRQIRSGAAAPKVARKRIRRARANVKRAVKQRKKAQNASRRACRERS